MPGKIFPPMKTSSTETIKGGRVQVHMIRMQCATKVLVSSQIFSTLKERPHVQVKDLIRGVLAVQIHSQVIIHCCLSCAISYQSCTNPIIDYMVKFKIFRVTLTLQIYFYELWEPWPPWGTRLCTDTCTHTHTHTHTHTRTYTPHMHVYTCTHTQII